MVSKLPRQSKKLRAGELNDAAIADIVKAIPPGGIFESVAELDAYLDDMQRQVRERT